MSVFGPILDKGDVEDAMQATLELWFPDYLAELERLTGRDPGDLPLPRSYGRVNRFDRKPEEQTPAVIIISPGLASTPSRSGDGLFSAWWKISVGTVVSARDRESTFALAGLYAAAVRTLVLQHPSLGGFASDIRWVDEGFGEVDPRYLEIGAVGQVDFEVLVEGLSDDSQGPGTPSAAPEHAQPDLPVITEVEIDTTVRSLT